MIIKVTGISYSAFYNQNRGRRQTKYYQPETATKEKIKRDFGVLLDKEIKKLNFEKFV